MGENYRMRLKNEIIENRIKELREEKRLSRKELADAAGISYYTLQRLENRFCVPNLYVAYSIAKKLDITIDEIFLF